MVPSSEPGQSSSTEKRSSIWENLKRAKSHAVIDGGGRSAPSLVPMAKAEQQMHRRRKRRERREVDHCRPTAIIVVVVMVAVQAEDVDVPVA